MEAEAEVAQHTPSVPTIGPNAPRVRITTGSGTSSQKTWNMRRVAMLLGTRRTAHLRLEHPEVSKAHALLVNTGSHVLLRDLCSRTGTLHNGRRADLALLCDGDVLQVGPLPVQVAIQVDASGCDDTETELSYQDPTCLPNPVCLVGTNDGRSHELTRAVNVIGRRDRCDFCLADETVSQVHAAVFLAEGGPAVFDLGSRNGVWLNEQRVEYGGLADGDVLRIGSAAWNVRLGASTGGSDNKPADGKNRRVAPSNGRAETQVNQEVSAVEAENRSTTSVAGPNGSGTVPPLPPTPELVLGDLEQRIASLHQNISESWQRLNTWQAGLEAREESLEQRGQQLEAVRKEIEQRSAELDARQTQLDERDAKQEEAVAQLEAKRADLQQLEESCHARRQELEALTAKAQQAEAALEEREKQCQQRQAEIEKAAAELESRRQEFQAKEQKLADQQAKIDHAAQQLEAQRSLLEQESAVLAERQEALKNAEQKLQASGQEVADQQAGLDRRSEQLDAREQGVQASQESLQRRRAEFEEVVARLEERESAIAAFRETLGRVNEVLAQPVVAPPQDSAQQAVAPGPAETPAKQEAEQDKGTASSGGEPAKTPSASASGQAAAERAPASPANKAAPPDSPAPARKAPPKKQTGSQSQAPPPNEIPVPPGLDAETADRLRMLRRLGAKGTNQELVAQIQAECKQPEGKKRPWWRRN